MTLFATVRRFLWDLPARPSRPVLLWHAPRVTPGTYAVLDCRTPNAPMCALIPDWTSCPGDAVLVVVHPRDARVLCLLTEEILKRSPTVVAAARGWDRMAAEALYAHSRAGAAA